jgi:signal transduction histidine kinase
MKIPFKVSARTARLIGRENVATSKGAIIELIKNGYDADSPWLLVYFDIFYSIFHYELTVDQYSFLENKGVNSNLLSQIYGFDDGTQLYIANVFVTEFDKKSLLEQTKRLSAIYIIDSGEGMTRKVIENSWMTIGTDNKTSDYITTRNRIKAGAKGIGRFALDKLGRYCDMTTFFNPEYHKNDMDIQETSGIFCGYSWQVSWDDFDVKSSTIDTISAELTGLNAASYRDYLPSFNVPQGMKTLFEEYKAQYGTILKITGLRDDWNNELIKQVYGDLDVLVPPRENGAEFKLYLYSSLQSNDYGEVVGSICDDFDYKLVATADEEQNITISIYRRENEYKAIPSDFFERPNMKRFPYSYEDFKLGMWERQLTFAQLIPGYREVDEDNLLKQIGAFEFTFYYLKKSYTSDDCKRFYYKQINSNSRKKWLDAFGGIKIYRDNFRVRPYGEKNDAAYDWLGLGRRKAQSPAGVAKIGGGYRVEPDNVAGNIRISRLTNINFEDKSSREGLQENPVFELFKTLICSIIHEFEKDRSYIAQELKIYDDERYGDKKERERIEAYAKKIWTNHQEQVVANPDYQVSETDHALIVMAQASSQKDEEIAKLREEQNLLRALASSGLVMAAFSHDLSKLTSVLGSRYDKLLLRISDKLTREEYFGIEDRKNPFAIIDRMQKEDIKIQNWLKLSIGATRKDKRTRRIVHLDKYFKQLKGDWETIFESRDITFDYNVTADVALKILEIDIDSIFNNLITNSIYAFSISKEDRPRNIHINVKVDDASLYIDYMDNGPGLSKDIVEPYDIFKALYTTKRSRVSGEEEGTGLGMWIVQTIIEENNGKYYLLFPETGFGLRIVLPSNN